MSEMSLKYADRMSVRRLAATGGIVMAAMFILCWVAVLIAPMTATHDFISLFTVAEPSSLIALRVGAFWAAVMGLVSGALIAFVYNLLTPLSRRPAP